MTMKLWVVAVAGGISIMVWLALLTRWLSSRTSAAGGIVDGQLAPCPDRPNCVSSRAAGPHALEPLRFHGDPQDAWNNLVSLLRNMSRCRIREQTDTYLHVECRTWLFGFIDDVEFLRRDDVIHVRSASRLGYSDLGVNRRRVESIRRAWAETLGRASL